MRASPTMPRTAHRRPRAGVTLVEVVIAIFILTVGVLSIISLFPSGYSLSQAAVDRSIAALAARDAQARILSEVREGHVTLPDTSLPAAQGFYPDHEPLYYYAYGPEGMFGVQAAQRVGTIENVQEHKLDCVILGNVDPVVDAGSRLHWPSLGGRHFLVITSGSAANTLLPIASSSGGTLSFDSAGDDAITFRTEGKRAGIPVRVGDHFAIIGNKTGTLSFPTGTTTSPEPATGGTINHSSFTGTGTNRTIPIATQGNPDQAPWAYSYGCIISAPTLQARHVYRVDVFVYRSFQDGPSLQEQERPVGHFVTHVHGLEDYKNP